MLKVKCLTLGYLLCLVTFFYIAPTRVTAQTTKPAETAQADHDQTLLQLLKEVRELRLVLQHATVINTRFQMLVERLKVQQAQVDALSQQLATVRAQLANLKAARAAAAARLKDVEDRLSQPSSAEEHTAIESVLKEGKRTMDSQAAEEQQQLESEADLVMRLQVEQGKLGELNNQLDVLMNELKRL